MQGESAVRAADFWLKWTSETRNEKAAQDQVRHSLEGDGVLAILEHGVGTAVEPRSRSDGGNNGQDHSGDGQLHSWQLLKGGKAS